MRTPSVHSACLKWLLTLSIDMPASLAYISGLLLAITTPKNTARTSSGSRLNALTARRAKPGSTPSDFETKGKDGYDFCILKRSSR